MSHKHITTLDPTKPPPPTEYRSNPRSRSRSRTRFQRSSHESDPLLSNLSPTSTLEALSYTELRPTETRKASSELRESIAGASSSERALGIRAASAAKKLKEWHAEVLGWAWPGSTEGKNGFEVPNAGDRDAELDARDAHGRDQHAGRVKEEEYWGSLPRRVVEEYEERIEVIADGMEALDVEELKSHVLEAHMPSRSRSVSTSHQQEASLETASHNHLDDFTAVVTATILQALPYVARLNILLPTWSVRLVILRQVPGFLRALEDASTAITSGWSTISVSGTSTPGYGAGISREAFNVMQPILEDRLTAAGQRLDRMLDALEGREDTVPKQWIDDMEMLEADYSNWVVEAEKKVLENELRQYRKGQQVSRHELTASRENVQNSPPQHPSVSEDRSAEGALKDDEGGHSINGQPSPQVSESTHSSVTTDLSSGPSTTNSRPSDKERLIVRQNNEGLPAEVKNDMAQEGVTVPPLKVNYTPPGEPSLPIAASPEPASTAKCLVSSIHSADMKNPSDTKDQELSPTAHNSGNHQPEDSDVTAARQHGKLEFDSSKHSQELSHEADSGLLTDHEDNKEPQPVHEVQPGTFISDPLPPGSFDPQPENSGRNTLQTDGATESQIPQTNLDEHTNQDLSDTSNGHGSGYAPGNQTSPPISQGFNRASEPGQTSKSSLLSVEPNTSDSLEDASRPSPVHPTEIDPDTSVKNATSLPMPESWDEEGVDTGTTESTANPTSPASDILGSETLVEPATEITSQPHASPREDGHEHNVERIATENRPGRPTALTLLSHITYADQSTPSEHSQPGSATSDFYSNASSPEIRDARAAQSFGKPVEVTSPIRSSERRDHDRLSSDTWSPSQQTVRGSHDLPSQGDPRVLTTPVLQRNRGSSFALEPTIHEDAVSKQTEDLGHEGDNRDTEMRRASIASIEVLSRKEVKSINVRRRSGSYSSSQPTPSGPLVETSGQRTPTSSVRRAHHTHAFQDDTQSDSPLSPLMPTFNEEELSPLVRKNKQRNEEVGDHKTNLASLSIPKSPARPSASPSRSQGARVRPWRRGASEPLGDDTNRVNKAVYLTSPTRSTQDQLEEKISSILTTIPAKIRLTSVPDVNAPEVVRPRSLSGTKRPDILSPAMRSSRNSSEGPSLTLAPAYAKSSPSSASSGDPEIRLYHLHQAGKDVPIKLYVRLVGEYGERVMVRVGGGWADLGEYLKEYANHHGRRSVSDGRFEIKGLSQGHSTSSITTLAGLSTTPTSRPGSALGRPASALSVRKSRFSSSSPADFAMPSTPDQPFTNTHDMTPGSTESYNTSIRPSSRSSWTGEDAPLGLAGPKSRRSEVSPGKQAWVDGMMQQAKRASAERKKTDENLFGDLGKVGGTKRVFMRSSKET